jgi:carboxyl-terminal processing protease
MIKKAKLFILIISSVLFITCKKDIPDAVLAAPLTSNTDSINSSNLLKDSTVLITRDIYLWNTQVPTTFNARSYDDPNKIMEAIRPYSMETGFADPVDRFSFAIKKTEWDAMSGGMNLLATGDATEGDFGLTVLFRTEGDLRVRLVEPNSPAGIAGIHRGWRIIKVNGNEDITTSNSKFLIDNIYESASASITFLKSDGSSVTISLNRAHYKEKPVYIDTILKVENKKIGYFVFNSFLGETDELFKEFDRIFNKFSNEGINELVVDLRYNGGGYVSVQEKLADYLVSSGANGNVMMKETYNAANSAHDETTLFKKAGSLNLNRIYFIVSKSTASASELLINNLRPYMNVEIVGNTTYGKPVGFFPIAVDEWYIFPVSFKTTNSNGEGNYFNGLTVNNRIADGLDKDWGDVTESCLASVIKKISSGSYRLGTEVPFEQSAAVANGNNELDKRFLKLTVGDFKNK